MLAHPHERFPLRGQVFQGRSRQASSQWNMGKQQGDPSAEIIVRATPVATILLVTPVTKPFRTETVILFGALKPQE